MLWIVYSNVFFYTNSIYLRYLFDLLRTEASKSEKRYLQDFSYIFQPYQKKNSLKFIFYTNSDDNSQNNEN